jgi:hypothetical protein
VTARLVVDHLRRLGAQDDGVADPEANEVFAYRPEAWRHRSKAAVAPGA